MGILSILTGPWGALIEKGLLVLMICGAVFMVYKDIKHQGANEQLLRDQNAQLVQLDKDAKEYNQHMQNIEKINNDILVKLDAKNQKVVETHDTVTHYIESTEGQKSNGQPVPEVIKQTIGILRNEK